MATARARPFAFRDRIMRSRLAHDAGAAFVLRIGWAATAFLAQVVAARVLGAEGFGVYAYVLAWLNVLPLLAVLGLDNTMLRFASTYRAREEWALLRGLERYCERRVLLAGLTIVAIGWGGLFLLGERLSPALAQSMTIGLLAVPVFALAWLRSALLRALGHIVAAMAPADLLRNALLLITLALFGQALPGRLEPVHALALTLLAALLSLAALSAILHWLRSPAARHVALAEERSEWRRTALPFLLLAGSQLILTRTDVLMLGWLMDTTAAGVYTAALRIADLTAFGLIAINMAAAPTIAGAHGHGDREQLQGVAIWTARASFAAALIIALPMALLAPWLLTLFGGPFGAGTDALRLLLVGQLFNAAAGSTASLLCMAGQERQLVRIFAYSATANAALNFLLIPILALPGAALASVLTLAIYNFAILTSAWKRLGVKPGLLTRHLDGGHGRNNTFSRAHCLSDGHQQDRAASSPQFPRSTP